MNQLKGETVIVCRTTCQYRTDGAHCSGIGIGSLPAVLLGPDGMAITVESEPLECPACKGMGYIETEFGKSLLEFLLPKIRAIVKEELDNLS